MNDPQLILKDLKEAMPSMSGIFKNLIEY